MKHALSIALVTSNLILLGIIFSSNVNNDGPSADDNIKISNSAVSQKVLAIQVPNNLDLAGEPVPLDMFDVKERMDREILVNTYWHSNSLQLFKLAARSFPVIEPILKEQGVPDDFKYLALAESGLRDVVSPANAAGVWQFLKHTARDYDLQVDDVVDERYHLEKATVAACKYLKEAKEDLGSWTLAAASYNSGIPRIKKLMETQLVTSYYNLYLSEETSRYVFRILAMKELFNNPERYGFYLDSTDLYKPLEYKVVTVDSSITDLPLWAIQQGTNYKTMKLMNSWLREPYLTNKTGKTYEIKVPM